MNKRAIVVITLLMAFVLVACGGKGDGSDSTSQVFAGSCTVQSTTGSSFCIDYTGSSYKDYIVQSTCSWVNGTYSTSYCDVKGAIGKCSNLCIVDGVNGKCTNGDGPLNSIEISYYNGYTVATESANCVADGGTWTTN